MALVYCTKNILENNILLRFLRSTMVIVCLFGVYDFFYQDDSALLKALLWLLAFGGCYGFVKYTNGSRLSIRVTLILFMLSAVSEFFFRGGFTGITALDFCAFVVPLNMILSGSERRTFLFFYLLQMVVLSSIQVFHSEWIVNYEADDPPFVDIAEMLARICSMLYVGYLYKTEYERERDRALLTSVRLEESNAEISLQNDVIVSTNNQLEMTMFKLKEEQAQVLEANKTLEQANTEILAYGRYTTAYNNQLKVLVTELKNERQQVLEVNEKLEEANAEISAQSETIASYNAQLEAMVEQRAKDILQLNKKLIDYSFVNSHKIRGPLARVLGLIYLMRRNPANGTDHDEYLDKLEISANELDCMVKELTIVLSVETNDQIGFVRITDDKKDL
ncbi:hypothetical protein [Chryseolinea soli]|uniref:Uncharacterized protein n=1 Tax=Chryseolinea soli TaxID=2321403 RepID=A0A385SR48_9BACT|nr:hypothetical protein [Chryseolinea soli]AYB32040.1 hypothetical protein D4L85_16340 [Chryseolinea soli]